MFAYVGLYQRCLYDSLGSGGHPIGQLPIMTIKCGGPETSVFLYRLPVFICGRVERGRGAPLVHLNEFRYQFYCFRMLFDSFHVYRFKNIVKALDFVDVQQCSQKHN